MRTTLYLMLIFTFFSSCQENPLGSATTVDANFHPGLDAPPKISSISPDQGPFVGGTNITLTGSGFTPESKIKMGGTACSQITYLSPASIVCLTPQHSMGVKDILIENKDGQKHTFSQSFTYISNVSGTPGFAIVSGGNSSGSTSLKMQSTVGEPVLGETMTGTTTQLRVGVSGILFTP